MAEAETLELTIDELARRTGMTVRNIRAHQSRGLLGPPALRGRTGIYGPDHIQRIELIRELQAEGFNLEGIKRLLDGAGGSGDEVVRFTRAVREPCAEQAGREVTAAQLAEVWGTADPGLLERSVKLGLLRPLGEGWYEEVSPALFHAGAEITRLGIPADAALDVVARLRKHADGAARSFIDLFLEQVWKPFDAEGRPEERWHDVVDALERLRPLAGDVLLGVFGIVMGERVEEAFGRELDRAARGGSDRKKR